MITFCADRLSSFDFESDQINYTTQYASYLFDISPWQTQINACKATVFLNQVAYILVIKVSNDRWRTNDLCRTHKLLIILNNTKVWINYMYKDTHCI